MLDWWIDIFTIFTMSGHLYNFWGICVQSIKNWKENVFPVSQISSILHCFVGNKLDITFDLNVAKGQLFDSNWNYIVIWVKDTSKKMIFNKKILIFISFNLLLDLIPYQIASL